jgi:hypothetical protein
VVQLDDGEEHAVPWTFKDLPPAGHHKVSIHSPGYEPKNFELDVKPGPQSFEFALAARKAAGKKAPAKPTGARPSNPSVDPENLMNPF